MRRFRRLLAAVALSPLTACGGEVVPRAHAAVHALPPPGSASSGDTVPAASERGIFVVERDGDTLFTERFTRTADRLETELWADGEERVVQRAELADDATIRRLELRVFAPGVQTTATPRERAVVTLRGDSAVTHLREGGRANTASAAVPPGTVLLPLDESIAMAEQLLRRAREVGGDRVEVPVLTGEGETVRLTVTFTGPTTARLQGGDTDLTLVVDAEGRLLGGRSEAQRLVIRRDSVAPAPAP